MLTRCCVLVVTIVCLAGRCPTPTRNFSATDLVIRRRVRYYDRTNRTTKEVPGEYQSEDPNDRVRRPVRFVHLTLPILRH